ncbi:MAG TPA: hypothetical protein DGT21_05850 [Armatimonadetes bacterium]|nr:hypothetical protein [Armatimonadota bacterium]
MRPTPAVPTVALLLALNLGAARAENLAPDAAYSVTISGYVYHGQIIPGTNTPATAVGFSDAPPWQGPPDTLTDGRHDGAAVTSWFWSNMSKRITVRFDLRRNAHIHALRVWPGQGSAPFSGVTCRIADTEAALPEAPQLALVAQDGCFSWAGDAVSGRFVELVCTSGAPQMSLVEVEIEGEPAGPVAADAPPSGLIEVPPRDLAPLVAMPERAPGLINLAAKSDTAVTVGSSHYDSQARRMVDDTCARDSDPTGRALVDGETATRVRSHSDWFAHKTLTVELDLGRPCDIDRVIVWSVGHGGAERSYINSMRLWLQAVPGAARMPAGETRNPLLPAEAPGPEYPIVSAPLAATAQIVRLRLDGVAQSADVMQLGEIEVWGKPSEDRVDAAPLRVIKPIPPMDHTDSGKLSTAYDWILSERLRGLYGYGSQVTDDALLSQARAVGFNCFIMHTSGPVNHSEDGWRAMCAAWAQVQATHRLRVIVSWPFGSDERYGNTQFGDYQPGSGQTWTRTPCPLSEDYWQRVIGDRAVVAAEAGLTGFVADMEMYGADSTRYRGPCYCDRCWAGFVEEHLEGIRSADVPLQTRPDFTAANDLSADYARRQELGIMAILGRIRERVRAIAPDFLLGNLLDFESVPGLARGFGTPTMPALVFSETEYGGDLTGMAERIARIDAEGYPALYLTGLTPTVIPADRMAELIRDAALPAAGYWVWSSLAYAQERRPGYGHNAAFTPEQYWQATEMGNRLLTDALRGR